MSSLLTQISWANDLEILSGTKSAEGKLFYLVADYETKLIVKRVLTNKLNQLIELYSIDKQK